MDDDGQFGMDDGVISQEADLCDGLAVARVNLNVFAQNQTCLAAENEIERQQISTLNVPFNNNGNYEDKQEKNVCIGQTEEDQDELMKEEDDFEESSLICCQSPDTPLTDSSYSETGSLQETYGFSPGTSPEPASPVPLMEDTHKQSHSRALDSCHEDCKTDSAIKSVSSSEQYTSSKTTVSDPKFLHAKEPGAALLNENETLTPHSAPFPNYSLAGKETSNEPCATIEITKNQEPLQLLDFLDQLAKRGDDTHLPQCLHQIAEAFVSQEDYQRAILCLQLEQLYHQRLLDNLSALQKQWETRCNEKSPAPTTQHLDTLKHICLTHSR